jgi:hypothetical protein
MTHQKIDDYRSAPVGWLLLVGDSPGHQYYRFSHDPQVEFQADPSCVKHIPMIAVVNVPKSGGGPAKSDHLRKPGDARADHGTVGVIGYLIVGTSVFAKHMRPGPDNAHMPQQYIDELGQLVQTAPSQEPAYSRDPDVCDGRGFYIRLIIYIHCPEFVTYKNPSHKAHSFLFEETRAFRIQFDQQHDQREYQGIERENH